MKEEGGDEVPIVDLTKLDPGKRGYRCIDCERNVEKNGHGLRFCEYYEMYQTKELAEAIWCTAFRPRQEVKKE